MDNKEYLEKIAKDTRAASTQKKKLFGLELSPTMIKLLIGGVILVIVMMIFGTIFGSGGDKERDYVDKIYLRTTNLIEETGKYNKLVKSSKLRSMGTSLIAVLTETQYAISTSLKEDFKVKSVEKPNKEQTKIDEDAVLADYVQTLENGKLNGILDRVYSREVAYQIGMLISLENDTLRRTKKDNLKTVIEKSTSSLESLYDQFNNFAAD